MTTEILKFEFNQQEVDFEQNDQTLMVNATQMAKIFGKQVNEFLSNEGTKSFIKSCLKNGNSRFLNIEKEENLVSSIQKSGTWMHRVLALKFAAWLDSDFEVWVYSTIDELLFGRFRRIEESLRLSAARKNRIDLLRDELRSEEKYAELERLELEERQSAYSRGKENKNQLELFRTLDN
ncbi:MAG: KilA-N domain-containing protein [Bacteroidales bacterium]